MRKKIKKMLIGFSIGFGFIPLLVGLVMFTIWSSPGIGIILDMVRLSVIFGLMGGVAGYTIDK